MSESYGTGVPSTSGGTSQESSGRVETAKHEAGELKSTATEQAKDVLDTAKHEASSVVGEASSQAKELYALSRKELADQAGTQQQRIALGLRAVSDELGSMASNSDQNGLAVDLVRQVSARLSAASSWLGDRDPAAVLTEVKSFARRKPGTFILGALVAGAVVGRLTRALAANASYDRADAPSVSIAPAPEPEPWDAPPPVNVAQIDDTPIYAQSTPAFGERPMTEDGDVRRDTF